MCLQKYTLAPAVTSPCYKFIKENDCIRFKYMYLSKTTEQNFAPYELCLKQKRGLVFLVVT